MTFIFYFCDHRLSFYAFYALSISTKCGYLLLHDHGERSVMAPPHLLGCSMIHVSSDDYNILPLPDQQHTHRWLHTHTLYTHTNECACSCSDTNSERAEGARGSVCASQYQANMSVRRASLSETAVRWISDLVSSTNSVVSFTLMPLLTPMPSLNCPSHS